jgi:hypothetical protein
MRRYVQIILLSFAMATSGCTPQLQSTAAAETACEAEFRRSAAKDHTLGRGRGLDQALRVCESLEEWTAASEAHPGALDGIDPETFLRHACRNGFLKDETLCSFVLP